MGPQLIIGLVAACHAGAMLGILRRLSRRAVPVGKGIGVAEISIIIPARNEARNLPRLLDSIRSQSSAPAEVLVVDDDSEDETSAIAAAHGARVIESVPLPAGWRGKSWACQQGARAARGVYLFFVDADCWFEPGALEVIASAYPGGACSLAPYHRIERPFEELSAVFNLIMVAATVPDTLLGPALLVDARRFHEVGGYESVRSRVLENVGLSDRFRSQGVPVRSVPGRGLLCFRMYPDGLKSVIDGWSKGFTSGAAATAPLPMFLIIMMINGLILAAVAGILVEGAAMIYLIFATLFGLMLRRVGNFSILTALLYPVPLAFYLYVFVRSLLLPRNHVTWKGRKLHDA